MVTGAGSGIGRAVVGALLESGFDVVLVGRRADMLATVAHEFDPASEATLTVPADLTDPTAVDHVFESIASRFGRLDLLFNNAGSTMPPRPIDEVPLESWSSVLAVNLTGAFLCTQRAMRMMKDQNPGGGRIINNGSISAHVPRPFSVAYTVSKHAITGLTKATSLEGREHRIACGQIDIGNASTDLTQGFDIGMPQADGSIRAEPRMDVRNVAEAVLHMASLPLEANVQFMTILATNMPYIGRG
jgi:NAD(P)-dependent dehydrogenase (short-subunit alcohol dehydrogenase family)